MNYPFLKEADGGGESVRIGKEGCPGPGRFLLLSAVPALAAANISSKKAKPCLSDLS